MSAAEDDTELRDLVIQNLENSGVLNKMKAEMRAAVFLAMEDQDRLENKVPLVNESLKKCLNSRDGDLSSAFLRAFSTDSILCVWRPVLEVRHALLQTGHPKFEVLLFLFNCPFIFIFQYPNLKIQSQLQAFKQKEPYKFSSQDGVPVLPADNEDLQQLTTSPNQKQEHLDLDLNAVVNLEEEDSFFDDPLPKPQKTYGCVVCPAGASDSRDGSFRAPSDRTGIGRGEGAPAGTPSSPRTALFLCCSHRSELSKSEQSIDEEIQEVSIEGPDSSDKLEETTLDVSVSQLSQADAADFMEDVS
uniref:FGFR1 oncogene partner n=1 Tax=Oryzias sinensis TaxID=183150 RepID=A0A8C7XSK7_9TELE